MGRGGRGLERCDLRVAISTALLGAWYEATKMTIRAARAVKYMIVTS